MPAHPPRGPAAHWPGHGGPPFYPPFTAAVALSTPMQIPRNLFLFVPGFLRGPRPDTHQQVSGESRVKAGAPAPPDGAGRATVPPGPARIPGVSGLSGARTLEQAVRALRADGRLPSRGSLVDLKA